MGRLDAEEGRRRGGTEGGSGGLTWLECWAIARYDLRLADAEWLAMTPRQLLALRRRRIEDMQRTELMFSRLTAATYNSGFARPETPVDSLAFMLHPFPAKPVPEEPPGDALLRVLSGLPSVRIIHN